MSNPDSVGELQADFEYVRKGIVKNRLVVFWIVAILLFLWLMLQVIEVTTLLLAAYGIALLLDPVVSSLERRHIPRSFSIIALLLLVVGIVLLLAIVAVPVIAQQYQELILYLPDYLKAAAERISRLAQTWIGSSSPDLSNVASYARKYISSFGTEHLKALAETLSRALFHGYSFVLTIVNIFLLPFFVFYLTRDIRLLHRTVGRMMPRPVRVWIEHIGREMLVHVYAFFKGQLTVCFILAMLYVSGLSVIGLPSAVIVGTLTGLLNIIPYLGVSLGFILASVIMLVTNPEASQLLLILAVFGVVQALEGTILTPRIVGKSVGIHPLVIMVTLIIGGKLFGLLGLILAVPAAAAIRVLFSHLLEALEQYPEAAKC